MCGRSDLSRNRPGGGRLGIRGDRGAVVPGFGAAGGGGPLRVLVLALILGLALGWFRTSARREPAGAMTGRIVDIIGGCLTVLNGLGGKEIYAGRLESQELQLRVTGSAA